MSCGERKIKAKNGDLITSAFLLVKKKNDKNLSTLLKFYGRHVISRYVFAIPFPIPLSFIGC